jgi:hypothetical protein
LSNDKKRTLQHSSQAKFTPTPFTDRQLSQSHIKTRNINPYAQMLEISSGMESHVTLPNGLISVDFSGKQGTSFGKTRNRMVRINNLYTAKDAPRQNLSTVENESNLGECQLTN